MNVRNRPPALHWAALLQAILLLPPMLVGSVCLRDGEAVTLEFEGCACLSSLTATTTPVLAEPSSPECGSCTDFVVTALAGSRVIAPGVQSDGVIQSPSAHRLTEGRLLGPILSRHLGDPLQRPPAVLRC